MFYSRYKNHITLIHLHTFGFCTLCLLEGCLEKKFSSVFQKAVWDRKEISQSAINNVKIKIELMQN